MLSSTGSVGVLQTGNSSDPATLVRFGNRDNCKLCATFQPIGLPATQLLGAGPTSLQSVGGADRNVPKHFWG